MSEGTVEVAEESELEWERVGEWDGEMSSAGSFLDAAVDGLMSWDGEGARLRLTDWMAEARSAAGLWAIMKWI